MSEEPKNNRRLIAGVLILGLLIGANLIQSRRRSARSPAPPAARPSEGTVASGTALPTSSGFSLEDRTAVLDRQFEQRRQRFEKIPLPLPPPDLAVELQLAGQDFFRWATPAGASDTIASGAVLPPPPAPELPLEIVGSFVVKGRRKILVKAGSEIVLLKEGEAPMEGDLALVSHEGDSFGIQDAAGNIRQVVYSPAESGNSDEVVTFLRSAQKPPTRFPLPQEKSDEKKTDGPQPQ